MDEEYRALLMEHLVDFACDIECFLIGREEGDALFVALFEGVVAGGEAFHEDDGGEFLEGSDSHDILVGLKGNPDVVHFGVTHNVAEKVGYIAAFHILVEALLARENLKVQGIYDFSYFHIMFNFNFLNNKMFFSGITKVVNLFEITKKR